MLDIWIVRATKGSGAGTDHHERLAGSGKLRSSRTARPLRTAQEVSDDGQGRHVRLQKVDTTTLRDAAFSALQKALMRGEFEPGQQLDLHEIAAALGVSVTPVKEAVSLLEHYGLLEVKARRGTCVRPITAEALRQACEARLVLECWAATCFPARVSPVEHSSLKNLLRAMHEVTQALSEWPDYLELEERFSELDFAYHLGIVAAAHNEYALHAYESLGTPFLTARALAHAPRGEAESRLVAGQQEHWRIYRALANGDVPKAVSEITSHVETSARRSADAIESCGGVI
jgi:GntR family transcriptional regulator, vanillate catabolism transcriptional regulator